MRKEHISEMATSSEFSGDGYLWAFLGNLTPNSVRTAVAAVLSDTSGRMRPLCSDQAEVEN